MCCIGSETWGGGHQGHVPPLGKVLPISVPGTVTFLTIPCHWNTCSDGSAIPEHGEQHSKNTWAGILAASSPDINLSTNVASQAISEQLILIIFLREHATTPP